MTKRAAPKRAAPTKRAVSKRAAPKRAVSKRAAATKTPTQQLAAASAARAATGAFAARAVAAARKNNARRKKSAAITGLGPMARPQAPPKGLGGSGLPFARERALKQAANRERQRQAAIQNRKVQKMAAALPSPPRTVIGRTFTPAQIAQLPAAPGRPLSGTCSGPGAYAYRQQLLARMQRDHDELLRCRG